MSDKDYYSFEEVLKDLEMGEDELKRLVSAGEIRAFRDKQTMRFKAEDVERLKDSPEDEGLDDLTDLDLDLGGDDAGLEFADDDLLTDLGDEDEAGGGDEELLLEDVDDEPMVEELDLGGGEVEELELGGADEDLGGGGSKSLRAKRKVGAEAAPEEEAGEGTGMLALLTLGTVALVLLCFVMFSAVAGHSNATNQWIVNLFS